VALVLGVIVSFVGRVEVTSRARGILRPVAGVRVLTARVAGTVVSVGARSGDRVASGAVLVRIDSPSAQADLLEADRQLESVRTQFTAASAQQDRHYTEQVEALKARAQRIGEQIESLRSSERYYQRRLEADTKLVEKGLVSEVAAGEWREQLAQAQRQLSGAQTTLDQTRQELASLESRRQDDIWNRQQVLGAAQNRRDALAVLMKQAVVEAPQDGTVELLVKPGEAVQPGQPMGKLVPVDSPLEVVSLLPERDRAFVKPGDEVHLELDQLPYGEYGALRGKIVRISDDLVSSQEVRDAFGEEQKLESASYRAQIAITDASAAETARVKLRTGGLMNVRYTLRRQRLITLVIKPLRRWLH
jgi:multidrug resistance efflux pump